MILFFTGVAGIIKSVSKAWVLYIPAMLAAIWYAFKAALPSVGAHVQAKLAGWWNGAMTDLGVQGSMDTLLGNVGAMSYLFPVRGCLVIVGTVFLVVLYIRVVRWVLHITPFIG